VVAWWRNSGTLTASVPGGTLAVSGGGAPGVEGRLREVYSQARHTAHAVGSPDTSRLLNNYRRACMGSSSSCRRAHIGDLSTQRISDLASALLLLVTRVLHLLD
jgi:hypothetical protein